MLTFTPAAALKLKEAALEAQVDPVLKAGVKGGGCAGYSYFFEFVDTEKINDTDFLFEQDGIKLYVDPLSYQYLEGMSIDYIDNGLTHKGFKFNNPNSKSTCGCGSSFSA